VDAPGAVSLAFGYDGSLPTDVTWSGPISGTVHVAFDNDFRLASESVNGEPAVLAHYDDDGLATSVGALAIARDPQTGRVKQTTIGSITEAYSFNDLGELSSSTAICGTTTLRTVTLARDAAGVITGKDESILGQTTSLTYDHDAKSRLTAVRGTGSSSTYTYDDNGNRRTAARPDLVSYSYDAQDRLTQHGNVAYAYTGSGQLQTRTDPAGTTSYHYDLLGNLRSVQLPDARNVAYLIDGLNRRIGKLVDNTLVQGFLYDGATGVVAELDGTGAVVSRFVYGMRSHVPDYLVKGGATYRIVTDAVGSPRLVVDVATCQVVQQIDYDEFGRVIADTNPGFQPFGFAGGLRDLDTGLLRFGARDYDPDIGRWTAKDPLGFAGGDANLYVYAANNPINFIDPAGLSFLQGLTDFSAGFGDFATFGLTRWVRKKLGVNDVVNPCSGLYTAGGITSIVVTTLATAGLGAGAGAAESGETVLYRLVTEAEPEANFLSNAAKGLAPRGPEVMNSVIHEGLSMFDSLARAAAKVPVLERGGKAVLGIAEVRIPAGAADVAVAKTLGAGHFTVTGAPSAVQSYWKLSWINW
jgi:RHS repeat-associated protein